MSDDSRSRGTSIGDALAMIAALAFVILFIIAVAIVTFFASPGMVVVGSVQLVLGLFHSTRQVWVLSIALSLTLLIVLVLAFRDVAVGVGVHFLLCCVTMILWSVLTYGLEFRGTEALAAVFFPGFTIDDAPSKTEPAGRVTEQKPVAEEPARDPSPRDFALYSHRPVATPQSAPRPAVAIAPEPEPTASPTPIPMASFRVALRLPLKHAYVMVRLDDREVFRCDFRPGSQDGTPELVTPPIEAAAGPVVVKVWVISPDKNVADEYVALPVELEARESRRLSLTLDPTKELKGKLLLDRG